MNLENEFSYLLGEAPQKYAIGSMNNWKVPARMSAGIPAAALANRPDVKQAETQLAVAYYATNESRAAFYPGLNLSGAIGWTNDLGTLPVNPGKWIWNAMASLTQPISRTESCVHNIKSQKHSRNGPSFHSNRLYWMPERKSMQP